ncbi:MAG: Slp family lipoprotein [Methylococcales bacterium]|nr:Slp family lipoprotein [Methylococcales bacterium]
MKRYFLLLYLLLVGCSSLPPTIENPPALDLAYSYATQDPARYKNVPVRWGGVIAEVETEQNESFLQVLLYPLNSYGRPLLDEQPQGRFVVKSTKFLDPLVYAKNSEITVAGSLSGNVNRIIGKKTMSLPLVLSTTLYLWPIYDVNNYNGYGGYGYGGYGYSGYGGFGYGGFGFPYYGYPHYGGYGGFRGGIGRHWH